MEIVLKQVLTHSLDGGTGRAKDDNQVKQSRLGPPIGGFFLQDFQLLLGQTCNGGVLGGILSEAGTFLKSSNVLLVADLMLSGICGSHVLESCMAYSGEWVCQLGVDIPPCFLSRRHRVVAT